MINLFLKLKLNWYLAVLFFLSAFLITYEMQLFLKVRPFLFMYLFCKTGQKSIFTY